MTPGKAHLEKHYADLAGKPFFPGLIECKFLQYPSETLRKILLTLGIKT